MMNTPTIRKKLRPALTLFVMFVLLCGVIYPALITLIGQTLFSTQANGSLIVEEDDRIMGSELIGQPFSDKKYFWPRPSATASFAYNSASSGASNLAPTNEVLKKRVSERAEKLIEADPTHRKDIPVDLVTTSASGLDPHISVAAAEYQVARVAKARQWKEENLRALLNQYTEGRQWGFLGERRINVLKLNLALDRASEPQ